MIKKNLYLSIVTIHYLLVLILIFPSFSSAFLFQKKKAVVIARVGSKTITKREFMEKMNRLHMSQRVGKSLAKETSFEAVNYRKFLDELIENKLIVLEAEKVGLNNTINFASPFNTYILNLSLNRLRQEEILNKVKVTDKDIDKYYKEKLKKDMPSEIPPREKQGIINIIYNEKINKREREYREYLRRKAGIEVDRALLDALSLKEQDMIGIVARVNGAPIFVNSLFEEWRSSGGLKEAKEAILDRLINRKLLDQEALKRRYDKEEELKRKIEKKRDSLLIDLFKNKVVLPLIRVEESDIKEYYEANKDRFKEPDYMRAKLILLHSREEAEEIVKELNAGADFSFLAEKRSDAPSAKRGGDMGWVSLANFPEEVRKMMLNAENGEVVGPFALENHVSIWMVIEKKEGSYKKIDEVKDEIDIIIGRKRFKSMMKEYIAGLRETVPIEINEEELKRLE